MGGDGATSASPASSRMHGSGGARSAARPRPAIRWRSGGSNGIRTGETLTTEKARHHADRRARDAAPGVWRCRSSSRTARTRSSCQLGAGQADRGGSHPDRSSTVQDTHQVVLWGQGEMHLRVALERLKRKYAIDATHETAPGPLQGDDPQERRDPRPAQEAVGRARPVRRRGAVDQAAAARRRASRSTRRSPAAWCRGSSFPRSRSA